MMTALRTKRRQILQYTCLALGTIVLFFLIGRMYQVLLYSPDDIAMKSYISGAATGTPDGHCWFLQYALSASLARLYRAFPGVEWYDLFFLGCLAGCFFLVFQRVFHIKSKRNKVLYLITSTLLIWILFAGHVINLEWTVTAGILGATGVFRYVTINEKQHQSIRILERVIILVLLLLCFLIRSTVLYMFFPLLIACIFVKILALKKTGGDWKRQLWLDAGLVLICVLLLAGLMTVHNLAYSNDEWAAYRNFTEDRSALFDYYGYPDYYTYQSYYEEAGISREMYELLAYDYNYLIPLGDSKQVDLGIIADLAKELHATGAGIWSRMNSAYTVLSSAMTSTSFLGPALILAVLFCCCFFSLRQNPYAFFLAVAGISWVTLVSLYLAFQGRLPIRVELCLLFGGTAVLGGLLLQHGTERPSLTLKFRWTDVFVCMLIIGCLCLNMFRLYSANLANHRSASEKAVITTYCQQHPGDVFLRDFWSFSQNPDFFLHGTEFSSANYIATGGWQYNMPPYQATLSQFGCESITEAVLEGHGVFYLVDESHIDAVLERLNRYYDSSGQPVYVSPYDALQTEQGVVYILKFNRS